jgi:hypothetical protein
MAKELTIGDIRPHRKEIAEQFGTPYEFRSRIEYGLAGIPMCLHYADPWRESLPGTAAAARS